MHTLGWSLGMVRSGFDRSIWRGYAAPGQAGYGQSLSGSYRPLTFS